MNSFIVKELPAFLKVCNRPMMKSTAFAGSPWLLLKVLISSTKRYSSWLRMRRKGRLRSDMEIAAPETSWIRPARPQ